MDSNVLQAISLEDVTILPCTQEGTFCLVDWTHQEIIIRTGLLRHNFPFSKCYVSSIWVQRSVGNPNILVRRAVLAVRNCAEWSYTLSPESAVEMETTLIRLALCLNKPGDGNKDTQIPKLAQGLPLDRRQSTAPLPVKALETNTILVAVGDNEMIKLLWEKSPSLGDSLIRMLKSPCQCIFAMCMSPLKGFIDEQTSRRLLFGDWVDWSLEPIMLRTVLVCRHGQQQLAEDTGGQTLTTIGEAQMALCTQVLRNMTNNFRKVYGILSSTMPGCSQSGDIIATLINKVGSLSSRQYVRVVHSSLDERYIPHSYEVFETDAVTRQTQERIKTVIDRDGHELEDTRPLFTSLLRGQGPLMATVREDFNPANLTSDTRFSADIPDSAMMYTYRLPTLHSGPIKVGGVYLDHAAATQKLENEGTHHTIYCGHANTMRFHVLEELGFPRNFWMHCMTPHAAVLPVGFDILGRPSLIIADSACTVPDSCLAWTFSPLNYGHKVVDNIRNTFLLEKNISLLKEKDYFEQEIGPGICYNAPNCDSITEGRRIFLIRKAHNVTRDGRDIGLSDLGHTQIQNAASWLAKLLAVE